MKIKLKKKDVEYLEEFTKKGQRKARALKRANILLLSHKNETETSIAKMLNVCRATVYNVKTRFKIEGLEKALEENHRSGQPKKYDDKKEAEIIALACTSPPKGRKKWTIRLVAEKLSKKRGFETLNRESVRLVLKKAKPSPG